MHMGDTGDTNDKNTVVTFELLFLNQGQGAGQSLAQACLLLTIALILGLLLLFLYLTNISYKKPASPFECNSKFNSGECFLNMLTVTD